MFRLQFFVPNVKVIIVVPLLCILVPFFISLGFEVDKAFSFLNLLSDLRMCRLLKQLGGHTVLNLSMDGAT